MTKDRRPKVEESISLRYRRDYLDTFSTISMNEMKEGFTKNWGLFNFSASRIDYRVIIFNGSPFEIVLKKQAKNLEAAGLIFECNLSRAKKS